MQTRLPSSGAVLEIGSGTGQHIVHLAAALPQLKWLPSEQEQHQTGLVSRIAISSLENIHSPIVLDVQQSDWPKQPIVAVFSANVTHIMSWLAVKSMLAGVARALPRNGSFYLYGPFHRNGRPTSVGNANFDAQLRKQNHLEGYDQGIRDDQEIVVASLSVGLILTEDIDMPANNRILVLTKSNDHEVE